MTWTLVSRWAGGLDLMWVSARNQVAIMSSHPFLYLAAVVEPAVFLLVVYYVRGSPTGAEATAIATAVLLMAYWGSTVTIGSSILRHARRSGALGALMRGVRDPLLVLAGKSFGATLAPAALIAATVWVTAIALGAPPVIASSGWFAVGIIAALIAGTALGTLLCSVFLLTRYSTQLSLALLYPVFLLAGLLIPPGLFPPQVSWLGAIVSLRWAQQFLVSAAEGTPNFAALGIMGLLTAAYGIAGVLAFRRLTALSRRRGTLELG
jgi:ABC-2 type transport system permease protein